VTLNIKYKRHNSGNVYKPNPPEVATLDCHFDSRYSKSHSYKTGFFILFWFFIGNIGSNPLGKAPTHSTTKIAGFPPQLRCKLCLGESLSEELTLANLSSGWPHKIGFLFHPSFPPFPHKIHTTRQDNLQLIPTVLSLLRTLSY